MASAGGGWGGAPPPFKAVAQSGVVPPWHRRDGGGPPAGAVGPGAAAGAALSEILAGQPPPKRPKSAPSAAPADAASSAPPPRPQTGPGPVQTKASLSGGFVGAPPGLGPPAGLPPGLGAAQTKAGPSGQQPSGGMGQTKASMGVPPEGQQAPGGMGQTKASSMGMPPEGQQDPGGMGQTKASSMGVPPEGQQALSGLGQTKASMGVPPPGMLQPRPPTLLDMNSLSQGLGLPQPPALLDMACLSQGLGLPPPGGGKGMPPGMQQPPPPGFPPLPQQQQQQFTKASAMRPTMRPPPSVSDEDRELERQLREEEEKLRKLQQETWELEQENLRAEAEAERERKARELEAKRREEEAARKAAEDKRKAEADEAAKLLQAELSPLVDIVELEQGKANDKAEFVDGSKDWADDDVIKAAETYSKTVTVAREAMKACKDFMVGKHSKLMGVDPGVREGGTALLKRMSGAERALDLLSRKVTARRVEATASKDRAARKAAAERAGEKQEGLFQKYDRDGDGLLSPDEVGQFIRGECNFDMEKGVVEKILGSPPFAGTKGVSRDKFSRLRLQVGIAAVEQTLGSIELEVVKAEKKSAALNAHRARMPLDKALELTEHVESAVEAARDFLAAAKEQVQCLAGFEPEVQKQAGVEAARLNSRLTTFDSRLTRQAGSTKAIRDKLLFQQKKAELMKQAEMALQEANSSAVA